MYGQLGHETCEDASDPKPVAALGACFARAVAAGATHTSVLVSAGGSTRSGRTETDSWACRRARARSARRLTAARAGGVFVGTTSETPPVERASAAPCTSVSAVSCSARHTACVTSFGDLVTWGWNAYGQLGVRDRETRAAPNRVRGAELPLGKMHKKRAPSRAGRCTVVAYGDDGTAS